MKPQTDDNPIPPYSENYTKEQKVHFMEWLVDVIHRGDPTDAIGSDMLSAMHVIDAIKKDVGSQMTKTAVPSDIKEMATMIIMGLLREEGWELPETNDEELTTHRLELALLDAVNTLMVLIEWTKERERQPKDYRPYLCILRGNSQGDDILRQRVLHYDFKKKEWCESDPSACVKGTEGYISWESVIWWKPLDWPTNPREYT